MKPFQPVLYVLGALLAAYLWLTLLHDPAVRRDAGRAARDSSDNARAAELRRVVRDTSLVYQRGADSLRGEIARLKARTGGRPTRPNPTVSDGMGASPITSGAQADSALLLRDSIITAQDSLIAQQDRQLAFYVRTLKSYQDSLVPRLQAARDSWRREAQPGLFKQARRALPFMVAAVVVWEVAR